MTNKILILLAAALLAPVWLMAQEPTPVPTSVLPSSIPTATPGVLSTVAPSDGLNPMNHAPLWVKFEAGYNYSAQGDLIQSAQALNGGNYANPGGLGIYTGSSTASNDGLGLGFELGLLLDRHSGLALGARYLQNNLSLSNLTYPNGPTAPDSEGVTLLPSVVPITLDYYYFIPDGGSRFFLTAGVGFYAANLRVGQNTTTDNLFGNNNTLGGPDIWRGNLSSAAMGLQVGMGREFALNDRFGFTLFVRGRYTRISNFQGQLLDSQAAAGQFGLAQNAQGVVDVDQVSNIHGNEHYAVVDFTGFDVGLALDFYSF